MPSDIRAIDAVVNIWTEEALSHRPDWGPDFFVGKMKAKDTDMAGLTLEAMIERMDRANIGHAFLIAAKSGRVGLPGCYHMPYKVVADAVEKYPDRFSGMLGIDPNQGMAGVREIAAAVRDFGCIGTHFYPHWFEIAPDDARVYPFYAKCAELAIPVQMQVGQSMIYAKEHRTVSVGKPHTLDPVACYFPELTLIGIHCGIPWMEEMIAMSWKHDNVFIGCDAHSPKYWPESFRHYINSYGRTKVLFGTDYPVLDFARTREEIDALGFKPEVLPLLLRENAIRVYGLDAATGL